MYCHDNCISSGRMLLFSATCTYSPGFCWAVHNNLLRQNCWVVIGAGRCLGNTVGGHPNQVFCQSNAWVHEGDNFETMTRFRFLFTALPRPSPINASQPARPVDRPWNIKISINPSALDRPWKIRISINPPAVDGPWKIRISINPPAVDRP